MSDFFQLTINLNDDEPRVLRGLDEKLAGVLWHALRLANKDDSYFDMISVSLRTDERYRETLHGFARGDFVRVCPDAFDDEHDDVWLERRGRQGLVLREEEGHVIVDLDPRGDDLSWNRHPVGFHPENLERTP